MKTLFNIILVMSLLLTATNHVNAQAIGDLYSYQGRLTNADGTPVANGTYSVTFKVYENNSLVLTSLPQQVTALGGVFNSFVNVSAVAFNSSKAYHLGIVFNGQEARHEITSVPVAQVAKRAETVSGPGSIPVGGVIMWWSDGTMPHGWAICDGSLVANGASLLNGKRLPDLRDKFVRGVPNSNLQEAPVSGGSDTVNLSHSHTVNNHTHSIAGDSPGTNVAGDHYHEQRTNAHGVSQGGLASTQAGGAGHNDTTVAGAHSHTVNSHSHGGATGAASPGTDSQLSVVQSIVPSYVGLVYIIRIF